MVARAILERLGALGYRCRGAGVSDARCRAYEPDIGIRRTGWKDCVERDGIGCGIWRSWKTLTDCPHGKGAFSGIEL